MSLFLFLVGVAALCASMILLAAQVGWASLAKHYGETAPFHGFQFLGGCHVGRLRYGVGTVRLGARDTGLRLAAIWPWSRLRHAPLFIPWDDIEIVRNEREHPDVVELRFARVPELTVRLMFAHVLKLQQATAGKTPLDRLLAA